MYYNNPVGYSRMTVTNSHQYCTIKSYGCIFLESQGSGHVPGSGGKFFNDPCTEFFCSTLHFLNFCTGKFFGFFHYFNFRLFSNHDCINFVIIVFLFGRKIVLSYIDPVVSFFLEMVSCYLKF